MEIGRPAFARLPPLRFFFFFSSPCCPPNERVDCLNLTQARFFSRLSSFVPWPNNKSLRVQNRRCSTTLVPGQFEPLKNEKSSFFLWFLKPEFLPSTQTPSTRRKKQISPPPEIPPLSKKNRTRPLPPPPPLPREIVMCGLRRGHGIDTKRCLGRPFGREQEPRPSILAPVHEAREPTSQAD